MAGTAQGGVHDIAERAFEPVPAQLVFRFHVAAAGDFHGGAEQVADFSCPTRPMLARERGRQRRFDLRPGQASRQYRQRIPQVDHLFQSRAEKIVGRHPNFLQFLSALFAVILISRGFRHYIFAFEAFIHAASCAFAGRLDSRCVSPPGGADLDTRSLDVHLKITREIELLPIEQLYSNQAATTASLLGSVLTFVYLLQKLRQFRLYRSLDHLLFLARIRSSRHTSIFCRPIPASCLSLLLVKFFSLVIFDLDNQIF